MKIWKNLFGNGDKIHADEIALDENRLVGDTLTKHLADYAALLGGGEVQTASPRNGWSGTIRYRKSKLGEVTIDTSDLRAGSVQNGTTICDIPSSFKPIASTIIIPAYSTASGSRRYVTGLVMFKSSLGLAVYDTNIQEGDESIRFQITYQTDV